MKPKSTRDLLAHLIAIPSVYPHEQKISQFLQQYLNELGYTVEVVESAGGRPNIVATSGSAKQYLGFYGHMDTVPPEEGYPQDPYQLAVDAEGIGHGLGVCDMKGGITAILQAAAVAREQNYPVKLVFGVDEEDSSRGAHDLVESGMLTDIGFLIVAESGQVADTSQDVSICYGRKGRVVFEIMITGKTAHAAEAEKGINAIESAARLIEQIPSISFPLHERLGKTTLVMQEIESTTGAMSVPDRCRLRLSALTNPLTGSTDVNKALQKAADRAGVSATVSLAQRDTPYGEGYETPLDHLFMQTFQKKVLTQYRTTPMYTASVADENVFAGRLGVPVLTIGPIGGGDHTKEEWVRLSSIDTVARIFINCLSLYY